MARHLCLIEILAFAFLCGSIIESIHLAAAANGNEDYHLALIGKQMNNPFFDVVFAGCDAAARLLSVGGRNVSCYYYGTLEEDAELQARIVEELVSESHSPKIDGISLSVINTEVAAKAIQFAMDAGVPVITFDSDAPESSRLAYIGTDNFKFGIELGKLLLQLDPEGGKYGVLAADSPNVLLRVDGVNEYLKKSSWSSVVDSPKSCKDKVDVAVEVMWEFAAIPDIKGIIAVGGWPMFDKEGWENFVDANRHLMLISGDSLDPQLDLINKGYVNALVGQLPYNMGEMSVEVLMQIIDGSMGETDSVLYGTEFLEILLFPLVLPPVEIDNNYLGSLVWMGYIFFGVIMCLSIGFCGWTYVNRANRVVVASQPPFLYMICAGTIILASTMIPLTFDDEQYSQQANDRACISIPWLASVGFTTTFAALFSKLWRVNRIFHNPNQYRRVVVKTSDVLLPYGLLMAANLIVLITWTIVSPMVYVRYDGAGTDGWNRVVYTYGVCESSGSAKGSDAYLICLAVINFGVLIMANLQAYQARTVATEFSESRYIAIIMASLMQTFIVGVPVVFLLREQPVSYFVVLVTLLLITCLSVLLFIFWPKVVILRKAKQPDVLNSRDSQGRENSCASGDDQSESEIGLRVRVNKPYSENFGRSIKVPRRDPLRSSNLRSSNVYVTGIDLEESPSGLIAGTSRVTFSTQREYVTSLEDDDVRRSTLQDDSEGFLLQKGLQYISEEMDDKSHHKLTLDGLGRGDPVETNNPRDGHTEVFLEESSYAPDEVVDPKKHLGEGSNATGGVSVIKYQHEGSSTTSGDVAHNPEAGKGSTNF